MASLAARCRALALAALLMAPTETVQARRSEPPRQPTLIEQLFPSSVAKPAGRRWRHYRAARYWRSHRKAHRRPAVAAHGANKPRPRKHQASAAARRADQASRRVQAVGIPVPGEKRKFPNDVSEGTGSGRQGVVQGNPSLPAGAGQAAIPLPIPRPPLPSEIEAVMAGFVDLMGQAVAGVARDLKTAAAAVAEPIILAQDRGYLVATARVGGTMARLGPPKAIGLLHPVFARRLASAVREARESGLPHAGVTSAYRPPGLGVGGFRDKFNSLHAYGLAVDMYGIGEPGSRQSKLWNRIANANGLYNPYWASKRAHQRRVEWNHYQPTGMTVVVRGAPLRSTITARAPKSPEVMWRVADALIDRRR